MKHAILAILMLGINLTCMAQKTNELSYLNEANLWSSKDSSTYVVVTNGNQHIEERKKFIIKDSLLYSMDSVSLTNGIAINISSTRYYPSGAIRYKKYFAARHNGFYSEIDSVITYYPNGNIKRLEYTRPTLGKNTCYDVKGNEIAFSPLVQDAKFPNGDDALYNYLSKNIKYPKEAYKNNIEGNCMVEFSVCTDGGLCDFKVVRGNSALLNEEAIRVIKTMPNWEPQTIDGEKVTTRFTLPINFSLGN